jgi:hypothetical protein
LRSTDGWILPVLDDLDGMGSGTDDDFDESAPNPVLPRPARHVNTGRRSFVVALTPAG